MGVCVGWLRGLLLGVAALVLVHAEALAQSGGDGVSDPASLPVFQDLTYPLATPLPSSPAPLPSPDAQSQFQSQARFRTMAAGPALTASDYQNCSANADQPTQEIVDLAAALKNDPQLIFNYVYENIDLEPSIESSKGALGTYLDQSGSSFDQANLLVTLLRAAAAKNTAIGHVQYVIGTVTLTAAQMGLRSLPSQLGVNAGATSATIPYAWVQAVINGVTTTYNPAGKTYTVLPGTAFSGQFGSQPTATNSAVSSYLTATSQAIYGNLGQNYAATTAFVGGRRLNTTAAPLTNMSTSGNQYVDTIPAGYRTVLQFLISQSNYAGFCTDQVYGHMVVSSTGTIWIDQVSFFTYAQGAQQNQTLWLTHRYVVNGTALSTAQSAPVTLHWAGWDVFNLGIGRVGRFRATHDANLASRSEAFGGNGGGGNSILPLLAMSSGQLSQTSHATELMDQLAGTYTQNHHMLQIVTNNETVNTPLISTSVTSITSTPISGLRVSATAVPYALSALQSAQEAVAMQGVGVTSANSAAGMLSAVSSPSGLQFLSHTNLPTTTLPGYNAAQNALFGDYLTLGYDLCLPVTAPLWGNTGQPAAPFLALAANGTSAFILVTPDGSLYKGAATPTAIDPNSFVSAPLVAAGAAGSRGASSSGLGINPSSGEVTFGAPLLSVGSKGSPYSLEFDLTYSSATAALAGASNSDGIGWSHNLEMSLTPSSDGFAIIGSDLAGPAVPGIVAMYELLLNSNSVAAAYAANSVPSTSTLLITSATAGWFLQQTNTDVVTLDKGGAQEVFAHMPDGSYRPLGFSPARLTLPSGVGGSYTLTDGHGTTMNFFGDGGIQTIADSGGHYTTFRYTTNSGFSQLYSVTTSQGSLSEAGKIVHTLTFGYQSPVSGQAPKLGTVTDDTGRSVSLAYSQSYGFYPSKSYLSTATLVDSTQAQPRTLSFGYTTVPLVYTGTSNLYVGGASTSLLELTSATDPLSKTTKVAYDSRQMPVTLTDALSNTTSYLIAGNRSEIDDAIGNASYSHTYPAQSGGTDLVFTDSYDAAGKKTARQYDYTGQLVYESLPNYAYPKTYTYDGYGNLLTTTWSPTSTSTSYNSCNLPLTTTDWLRRTTTYIYESITGNACLVGKIVHPTVDGTANTPAPTEQFTYTDGNRISQATAADGEITTYSYGNPRLNLDLSTIIRDAGNLKLTTNLTYDGVGNVTAVQDPRLYTTTYAYDAARRVTQKTTPAIAADGGKQYNTIYRYDLDGHLTETDQDSPIPGQPSVSKTTYDAVGNALTTTQPTTSTTTVHTTITTYDADNRVWTITDPAGQKITRTYDADSRLYQVLDGNNQVSQTYGYTDDGLTQSITDGNGHAITYTYDWWDSLTKTTYADGTYEQLTLDNGHRVTTRRDRAAISITYSYDNLDRESSETNPDSSTPYSYTYDLVGRPLTVTDLYGTFTYLYDTAGRQKQTTRPDGRVIAYTYDADGNTSTIAYPDAYLYTYGYDELDRMTGVSETPPGGSIATMATYSYDALSRRTGLAYANTTSSAYAYDDFSGLTSITHNFAATSNAPVVTYSYTRDANERRQTDTVSVYGLLQHPAAAGTTTYQANTLNQYTAINGQTLTYGARGNLGNDPTAPLGSATYAFDNHSRMITASNSQHSASYAYDAMARRAQSTVDGSTKVFVNDGSRTIAEYTPSGAEIQHYVYGADSTPIMHQYFGGQPLAQFPRYYHTDALGSVVYISDQTGKTTASFTYSPWGEAIASGATPYRYAGMRLDTETLLYYDHARYYSPQQGRFISPDPIGVKGGLDLYAYAGNDPVNATDPTGLIRPSFWDLCGGDGPSCAPPRTYFPGGSGGLTPQQGSDGSGLGIDVTDFEGSFAQGLGGGDGSNATQYAVTLGGQLIANIIVPDYNNGQITFENAPLASATGGGSGIDVAGTGDSLGYVNGTYRTAGDAALGPNDPVALLPIPSSVPDGPLLNMIAAAQAASESVPSWTPYRGTAVHSAFSALIDGLGPDYTSEQSYLGGVPIRYGFPGSSRADAVYGPIGNPVFAFDLKTGGAYLTQSQFDSYQANLPADTPIVAMRIR